MNIRYLLLILMTAHAVPLHCTLQEQWITVLVHGIVGLQANFSFATLIQAKRDLTPGTLYEKNVRELREHPYLSMIQPIGKLGLQPVLKKENCLYAAYAFGELFSAMERYCGIHRKNRFYTFGWSGIVSGKGRLREARLLYMQLKEELSKLQVEGPVKVRIIGFSHGATLLLTMGDIRARDFAEDGFSIDEVYLLGMPVTKTTSRQAHSPLFKEIYSFYSRRDSVQRLDIFSTSAFFSHRVFKGRLPCSLTQIELRITAPLRANPVYRLPSFMRGVINQSPGHSELWFFGWTQSSYRKNLSMYPLPASIFTPYLVHAAKKVPCKHIQIDIRPCRESSLIRAQNTGALFIVPFLSPTDYTALINEAFKFHPSNQCYKENFLHHQASMNVALRDKGQRLDSF
ncbi:hypothetical protein H0W26_04285 [Candidatus Dependentiae bacterium]|nr:hypothetical protein [Candidatus Dependentiae bacterium]